jgi:hypothetical protein
MQFRFRFVSNDTGVERGVFLDNIGITGASYIFGPDDCTDLDDFIVMGNQFGDWWQVPHQDWYYFGWLNILGYLGVPVTPAQTGGVFDPLMFFAPRPWNGLYPNNLDNSFDWTLTLPHAFYGYIITTQLWDLPGDGDIAYLQVSDDGVNFDELDNFAAPGYYWNPLAQYDLTDYLNSDVTIRQRFQSDAFNPGTYWGYYFEGMTFYGMEDTNPPVTTCTIQGDFDPLYMWYTEEVAVFLEATDDVTGVKATYYEVDGGTTQTYTGPFLVTGDGIHQVCYWSVDNEDNVETKKCTAEFRIDATGPSVEITGPTPGLYLCDSKLLDASKIIALFCGITVTATASADDVPLKTVQFFMGDTLFAEDTTAPFSAKCTLKNSGGATFKVKAIDLLDRSAEDTLTVDTYIKLL